MTAPLRLGVIGLSPGNGHPYSWSAIFNGYNPTAMEDCGFPVIPRYLEKQKFPDDSISEAHVTHVWTQDPALSRHVAKASLIDNVVNHFTDLIGQVDGVLLARDDADNHYAFAQPFLDAGLPLYVDKPIALSLKEACRLIDLQQFPGQLFSCSALRYAPELKLNHALRESLGDVHSIQATVSKDWDKYAVHIIEPLLGLLPDRGLITRHSLWRSGDHVNLHIEFSSGIDVQICTLGQGVAPLGMRVIGSRGWCDLHFTDTFGAFRAALQDFVYGILDRDIRIQPEAMLEVVQIIELGRNG